MNRPLLLATLAALFIVPATARGAIITDVQSSFDANDPFDIKLTLGYEWNYHNVLITREALKDSAIVPANKLEYDRTWHEMHVGLAVGLYRDLELVFDLPIILADQVKVGAHPSVSSDPQCGGDKLYSSCINDIDPSANPWNFSESTQANTLFDVPFTGKQRAGIGDIGLGIRWAPWHYKRDHQYPSWLVGVMLRIPTAEVKTAYNEAVGEGLFQVEINTAISRRVASFFEPYFDLHGKLRFATDDSLFTDENQTTQTLVQPGHTMGLKLGAEFIPWEVEANDQHVAINIGGGLDYVFEGREYAEMWEALGSSPCLTMYDCDMTTYTREPKGYDGDLDAQYAKDQRKGEGFPRSDGITDVEHYSFFSFWAGLDVQPIQYFQLGVQFKFAYVTPHFITFADAGKDSDLDNDTFVTGENNLGDNEYNPKYIEALDEVGQRFRASQSLQYSVLVNLSGRF
jgi:hypothetical protein